MSLVQLTGIGCGDSRGIRFQLIFAMISIKLSIVLGDFIDKIKWCWAYIIYLVSSVRIQNDELTNTNYLDKMSALNILGCFDYIALLYLEWL